MEYAHLPEKTLTLWRVRTAIAAFLPFFICVFFTFKTVFMLIPALAIALFVSFAEFYYLPQFFKRFSIAFSDDSVIINRGVFIRTAHILPYSRLIYLQTLTSPLSKRLNLSALSFKAARNSIVIPELERNVVEKIIKTLSEVKDR